MSDDEGTKKKGRRRRNRRKAADADAEDDSPKAADKAPSDEDAEGGGSDAEEKPARRKRRKRGKKAPDPEEEEEEAASEEEEEKPKKRSRKKRKKAQPPSDDELSAEESDEEDEEEGGGRRRKKKKGKKRNLNAQTLGPGELDLLAAEDFTFEIDDEDIPSELGLLAHHDRLDFLQIQVGGDFGDSGGANPAANAEEDRKEMHYVESFTTGHFKKTEKVKGDSSELAADSGPNSPSELPDLERISILTKKFHSVVGSVLLFCQGVLTGFIAFHIYWSSQAGGNAAFLKQYGIISGSVRRLFYVLTTLAFVVSGDRFLQSLNEKRSTTMNKVEYFLTSFLYFIVMLISLCIAPVDDKINHVSMDNGILTLGVNATTAVPDQWVEELLGDPEFVVQLEASNIAITARFVIAMIAWALVCRDIHQTYQKSFSSDEALTGLRSELNVFYQGMSRLGGVNRNELVLEELRALRDWQAGILKETEAAIDLRLARAKTSAIEDV